MASKFLSVDDVALDMKEGGFPVKGQSIREQARTEPRLLGFPVSVIGNKVLIPAEGYENWKKGITYDNNKTLN